MNSILKILFSVLISVTISFSQLVDPNPAHRRISGFGSSVCSGTGDRVTGKGYIGLLKNIMDGKGWEVVNASRGGDNTETILERWDKNENLKTSDKKINEEQHLVQHKPDCIIIGLSLANEGIINEKKESRDSVFDKFQKGMLNLIEKGKKAGYKVIIANCYSNNQFSPEQYEATRKMNILQNKWGVPLINFLGTVDDGNGHWVPGFFNDDWHPSYGGHKEMCFAIVPSLFEAIEKGKPVPVFTKDNKYAFIEGTGKPALTYSPVDNIHSFTLSFSVKGKSDLKPATISGRNGMLKFVDFSTKNDSTGTFEVIAGTEQLKSYLFINGGIVSYVDSKGFKISSSKKINNDKWTRITISHLEAKGETSLFVNNELAGKTKERFIPASFDLAIDGKAGFKDVLIYRSAFNQDEVGEIVNGNLIHSSLEIYAPLNDSVFTIDRNTINCAQSHSALKIMSVIKSVK